MNKRKSESKSIESTTVLENPENSGGKPDFKNLLAFYTLYYNRFIFLGQFCENPINEKTIQVSQDYTLLLQDIGEGI